jgi:DNA-binding NarL/FixJ family response regulator
MNSIVSSRRRVSPTIRLVCIGCWILAAAAMAGKPIQFRGAYRTGGEAIRHAKWKDVDVAVIDDRLPDLDTLACLDRIGHLAPHVRLIVACEALNQRSTNLWFMAGAAGCMAKSALPAEVASACSQAFDDGFCLPPSLCHEVMDTAQRLQFVSRLGLKLTHREMDTLIGVLLSKPNKDIAARLGVGLGTVKTHVRGLLRKFGVASRIELVARCASVVAPQENQSPLNPWTSRPSASITS